MATSAGFGKRNNPFVREHPVSPPPSAGRPKSMAFLPSQPSRVSSSGHTRNRSYSGFNNSESNVAKMAARDRAHSKPSSSVPSSTFAPKFIGTEEAQRDTERIRGIEGEGDFSGKRYIWLKDPQHAFIKGWVVEERAGNQLLVQCDDGSVSLRYFLIED